MDIGEILVRACSVLMAISCFMFIYAIIKFIISNIKD